ncbi:MAG: GIY-YIG nuclease family protein [Chloroflexaceae bacterium]|jgi:hypothetical protein|nr:GIY-YIG nuclease family protein [Chloroflexaceae bacterium]
MTTATATATTARSRPSPGVYLFKAGTAYKIGVTTDVGKRRKQVQAQCADPLEIIHVITDGDAKQIERQLHETFHHRWLHGEWFELTPQDVARIKAGQFTPPPPAAPPAPPADSRPSTTHAAATQPRPATGERPSHPQPPRPLATTIARSFNAIGWTAVLLLLGAGLFVGSAYYEKSRQWAPATVEAAPMRPVATVAPPTAVPAPPPAARLAPPVVQPVIAPPPAAPAPAPAAPVVPAPAPPAEAPPVPTAAPATEGGGTAAGAGRIFRRFGTPQPTVEP